MRILLVEDEKRLAEALSHIFKKEGFLIDVTGDGAVGQDMAETNNYDVIILDRMLPNIEGVNILNYLRTNNVSTPIIFLTAKDTVYNRIEGLDAGADDYLVKPFSKDELLARVKALARRSKTLTFYEDISLGALNLNIGECEAIIFNEKINLSIKEAQLLELLLRNRNQVLSKEQILNRIWGYESEVEIKIVDLYIFYLRKKIDFTKAYINLETIRGKGYLLKEI